MAVWIILRRMSHTILNGNVRNMRIIQIAAKFGVAGLFLGGLALVAGDMAGAAGQSRPAKLVVPELSDLAKTGNAAFDQACAKSDNSGTTNFAGRL